MTNPNSLANLRPAWKPGEVANPRGRPPLGPSLKEIAQKQPDHLREKLVVHILNSALESSSATAARWAQLFADISGDGGAAFKLQVEASGPWADIMLSLREKLGVDAEGRFIVEGESKVIEGS